MGEKKDAAMVLVREPEGKRPLGRPIHKWEIEMDINEIRQEHMDWIHLIPDRDKQWALINMTMNFHGPLNVGHFLLGWLVSQSVCGLISGLVSNGLIGRLCVRQTVSQSVSQSVGWSVRRGVSRSVGQSVGELVHQCVSEWDDQSSVGRLGQLVCRSDGG
jgi:hypothetical protein